MINFTASQAKAGFWFYRRREDNTRVSIGWRKGYYEVTAENDPAPFFTKKWHEARKLFESLK